MRKCCGNRPRFKLLGIQSVFCARCTGLLLGLMCIWYLHKEDYLLLIPILFFLVFELLSLPHNNYKLKFFAGLLTTHALYLLILCLL